MITSRDNPQVKRIRQLAADRRARHAERLFVLEGLRLLADALDWGANPELILYAPEQLQATAAGRELLARIEPLPMALAASPQALAAAADTVQPQGVLALAAWPQIEAGPPGLQLVLDAIQDPGNLGTLLRSAEAVGVTEVFCSPGCADAYSPKVTRAAMGAHFRLSLVVDLDWDAIRLRVSEAVQVYAADAGAPMPYYAADWKQPAALIIGNEAQGLSEAARASATRLISIPMLGQGESLNAAVAGSIILFEALRQRTRGRT